ncbi:hypothetical protein ACFYRC_12875 [Streptomyces sp. NPDC005279]|uniref:hypothetical protein n=1 Tax=Streptomyces sp. NPDC005279 TaxID=3364712 RepID=UPI0036A0A0F9
MAVDPSDFCCSRLAMQLADEWVEYVAATAITMHARVYHQAILRLCKYVDKELGAAAETASLTDRNLRDLLLKWELALPETYTPSSTHPGTLAGALRVLIIRRDDHRDRPVDPDLARLARGPALLGSGERTERDEFKRQEKRALVRSAWHSVHATRTRLEKGWALAEQGRHPEQGSWTSIPDLLWGFAHEQIAVADIHRLVPPPREWPSELAEFAAGPGRVFVAQVARVQLARKLIARLYPNTFDLHAFRILLMDATGYTSEEVTGFGDTEVEFLPKGVRLTLLKNRAERRRHRAFRDRPAPEESAPEEAADGQLTVDWPRREASEVVRQLMDMTAHVRAKAPDVTHTLFVSATVQSNFTVVFGEWKPVAQSSFRSWLATVGVEIGGDQHVGRLRKSAKVEKAIVTEGRISAAADDHTEETFARHYAQGTTLRILSGRTIATAQQHWLAKALDRVDGPTVISDAAGDVDQHPAGGLGPVRPGGRGHHGRPARHGRLPLQEPLPEPLQPIRRALRRRTIALLGMSQRLDPAHQFASTSVVQSAPGTTSYSSDATGIRSTLGAELGKPPCRSGGPHARGTEPGPQAHRNWPGGPRPAARREHGVRLMILPLPEQRRPSLFRDDEPVVQGRSLLPEAREPGAYVPRFGDKNIWNFNGVLKRPANCWASSWIVHFSFELENPYWNLLVREFLMMSFNPRHPEVLKSGVVLDGYGSPSTLIQVASRLRTAAKWGRNKGLPAHPDAWTVQDLRQRIIDLSATGITPDTVRGHVTAFKTLAAAGPALSLGWPAGDPWPGQSSRQVVQLSASKDLATSAVPPETWFPLIRAAWAYLHDFAPDVLRADRRYNELLAAASPSALGVDERLEEWLAAPENKVPLYASPSEDQDPQVNWSLLMLLLGYERDRYVVFSDAYGPLNRKRRARILEEVTKGRTTTQALAGEVVQTARQDGSTGPWHPGIGPRELKHLRTALRDAAFTLIVGLSMMRDSEIHEILRNSVVEHYSTPAVASTKVKGTRNRPGKHWWIAEPLVEALAVAEFVSLHPERVFSSVYSARQDGAIDGVNMLESFVRFVNTNRAWTGLDEIPAAYIRPHMFRKTMAMLTDQFPGSEIATGIQLKHLAKRALANATTRSYAASDDNWAKTVSYMAS